MRPDALPRGSERRGARAECSTPIRAIGFKSVRRKFGSRVEAARPRVLRSRRPRRRRPSDGSSRLRAAEAEQAEALTADSRIRAMQ